MWDDGDEVDTAAMGADGATGDADSTEEDDLTNLD